MANMKYQKQRIDGSDVIMPEPQHLEGNKYVNTGTSNPLPTKDESVEARLQAIEQTQSQILDKLNDTIDTRLTGSKGEYETYFEREIRNESTSSARMYKPDWAKGFIAYLLINGVTGSFGDNQGIALRYRGGYSNSNYAYSVLTGRTNVSNRAHILTVFPSYGVDGGSISSSGSSQRHIPSILPRIVALSIEVSGTFAQGEGFDSEVIVEWVQ